MPSLVRCCLVEKGARYRRGCNYDAICTWAPLTCITEPASRE